MDANRIGQFASDPAAFQAELLIPSVTGPKRFGNCMAPFQRERFALINQALVAVATGTAPAIGKHWWEATKGASKDSDLAVCLLWLLAFTRRPLSCQIGAADQDQAGELRKAAKDILNLNPWLARRVRVNSWQIICDGTSSTCEIIAADVAGSHGARPDVLILNELSHVTKQEFAENLLDNAAKVPQGLTVIATNAGLTETWQYKWREIARESARWCFHQWSQPSPWLNPEDIEEAKRRNSKARYLRLWWGQWASGSGDALDETDIAAAIDQTLRIHDRGKEGFAYASGLDLSTRRDRSALVTVGLHLETQKLVLADVQVWAPGVDGKVDLQDVQDGIRMVNWRMGGLSAIAYDPYQAELMAQQLIREGYPMFEQPFVGRHLTLMATTLLQAFRERRFTMYPDADLIRDLGRLSIVETSFGYKLTAPRDKSGHADRATALAIVLPWAMSAMAGHCEYEYEIDWIKL